MKRIIFFFITAVVTCLSTNAAIIQHVMLKNGSVLNGYVQQASNGILTFHSDNAIIVVDKAEADITDQPVLVSRLDSAWVTWGEKNDAIEGTGSTRTLTLSTIILRNAVSDSLIPDSAHSPKQQSKTKLDFTYYLLQKRTISNVRVLERGAQIRYMEQSPNVYTFTWADVAQIRIDRRPRTALSGIDCIYELKNGRTYQGQPAGETENSLSLYINGSVQSFPIDDVIKYTYKGINPEQDIIAQSELLDVVRKNNGAVVRGIIIEQNYSSTKDNENYILINTQEGAIQSIRISEIAETMKEINTAYKPINDVILEEGSVLVNRNNMTSVKVTERDYILTLDSICHNNVIPQDDDSSTKIIVEYRNADSQNVEMFRLVKVTQTEVKRKTVYSFSYKDLSESIVRPSTVSTSVNNTTRAEYIIPSAKAIYALYNDKTRTAIPLMIKKK